ncbi:Glucose-1-phosphate thymidylyltransferase [Streptomyces sp. YIM 130001]|uniref:glucose-1-phosphate thymidylyltransferase n=1 Tax=Streptomyces sp. YIM 130001 TaxID=2259644 RepID=UPI000E659D49|nr:glucose-1-phosphate thymidylyltransferase [Streptomyces sp. YIM 130001]RII07937.1 Glucose-1-phosphate thymidylyltransferase [Streptomyces sp. YIM 130001]
MKALVLAGGSGTRLRPLSHSMPKQLVPVAGRPVLEYGLESLRNAGIRDIGVVVGGWASAIKEALGDGSRLGVRITYIRQEQPLGLAHCVRLAKPFLGDSNFAMFLGDIVMPGGIAGSADEFRSTRPEAHLLVRRVADPRAFGVVELAGRAVRRLVEKPQQPQSDLALTGVYFFTPAIHRAVDAIGPSARGELEITDAIQWLVDHGAAVTAEEYDGYWRDTGDAVAVLDCNRHLLSSLSRSVRGDVDVRSRLSGRVVVEPGAHVVASRITGPAIIGAGTCIENCVIDAYTSIGRGCLLNGTRIGGSVVLDDATVSSVPLLQDSIIGRAAVVGPASSHHRLVIGDHTRIEIAA